MTVLFLGDETSSLVEWLEQTERVVCCASPIDSEFVTGNGIDFVVSYRYRHIIGEAVLARVPDRAINLHISLLPWNRGADPNLWSFIDNTPKGVTIHYLDTGIDTGDIIVQQELSFGSNVTLAKSYRQLTDAIEALFRSHWPDIRAGRCPRMPQTGKGSFHTKADRQAIQERLTQGWDTDAASLSRTL